MEGICSSVTFIEMLENSEFYHFMLMKITDMKPLPLLVS